MKKKSILALALVFCSIFCFGSCSKTQNSSTPNSSSSQAQTSDASSADIKVDSSESENNEEIEYKNLQGYNFAIPSGYTDSDVTGGYLISNDKVCTFSCVHKLFSCDDLDKAIEVSDEEIRTFLCEFNIDCEKLSIKTKEKFTNKNGYEMLKVTGEILDGDGVKLKDYYAFYTIAEGYNGKCPAYCFGFPFTNDNQVDLKMPVDLIADNFGKAD